MEDAVDLMTIHTAKGLEWDVVLVPALEKRGQSSRSELLNWLEFDGADGDAASVVLAPIQRKGERSTDLYQWLNCVNKARGKAERKRLLYVACTRAREALHLFAAGERNAAGEIKAPFGTLLESYWTVAQQHFANTPAATATKLTQQFAQALDSEQDTAESDTLALAAAADPEPQREAPLLYRLPISYDPGQRFLTAAKHRLPYPAASAGPHESVERPEGSFAVRAFGNVVHRFLQLLATRMAADASADALLRELPTWQHRLLASLRGEGLSSAQSAREATRALAFLTSALKDPIGSWILSPKSNSGTESSLTLADAERTATMRVDRTFTAGPQPLGADDGTLWIIDFKTTEQGARSPERFAEEERAKYSPQLLRYAALLRAANGSDKPVMLGLYYPAVPRLIHWPA